MRFWGIIGTNGKTTVTWILARFLKSPYITTVEVSTGARRFYTSYTTPPLAQLKEIYAEMAANGAQDCVMEVSSHAIVQRRTGDTVYSGGVWTNISEDHLDYHKTMEAYFAAKLLFAERLAESGKDGAPPPFVVCPEAAGGEQILSSVSRLRLNVIPVYISKPQFDLSELKLPGAFNQANVLAAAGLAEAAGVPHAEIQALIPTLHPRWGRLEPVACRAKAKVFVDFAHTPDGLEKVLSAVRALTKGRIWVVFGAGGDRDPMKRPLMGAACAAGADQLVVTSDNPRSEDPEAIIDSICTGIPQGTPFICEPDRKKAIEIALQSASADDLIIICGKGHETTQEIKGVKYPFDDRAVVRAFGQ